MAFSRSGALVVAILALAASGCQSSSSRFDQVDTRPEPLPAAPAGSVTSNSLPPPTNAPGQFPTAPVTTQPAVVASAEPPASAPDLTPATVGGVWTVSVSGQSCKIATSQTKYGQGFRAGPLRCPSPVDGVKSWNVAGKQLSLYDESGSVMARLYSSGNEKFDGQTSSGVPISFSR